MAQSQTRPVALPYDVWHIIFTMLGDEDDLDEREFAALCRTCRLFNACIEPILYYRLRKFEDPMGQVAAMCKYPRLRNHLRRLSISEDYDHCSDCGSIDDCISETQLILRDIAGPNITTGHHGDSDDEAVTDNEYDNDENIIDSDGYAIDDDEANYNADGDACGNDDSEDDDDSENDDDSEDGYNSRDDSFDVDIYDIESFSNLYAAVCDTQVLAAPRWDAKLGVEILHGLQNFCMDAVFALVIWMCPRINDVAIYCNKGFAKKRSGRMLRKLTLGPHPALHIKNVYVDGPYPPKEWRFLLRLPSLESLRVRTDDFSSPCAPEGARLLPAVRDLHIELNKSIEMAAFERILRDGDLRSLALRPSLEAMSLPPHSPQDDFRISLPRLVDVLRKQHRQLESLDLHFTWEVYRGTPHHEFPVGNLSFLHCLASLTICEMDLFGLPNSPHRRIHAADVLPCSLVRLRVHAGIRTEWEPTYEEISHMNWIDEQCQLLISDQRFPRLICTSVNRYFVLRKENNNIPLGGFWQREGSELCASDEYQKEISTHFHHAMDAKAKEMQEVCTADTQQNDHASPVDEEMGHDKP